MALIDIYKQFPDYLWLHIYRRRMPRLVNEMRSKPRIKVLFILHCLDKWKTEGLYRLMLRHERFEPTLGLAMSLQEYPTAAVQKFQLLKSHMAEQGYDYVELCQKDDITRLQPDIIFYMEPYNGVVNRGLEYRNAPRSLFCFSTYGIHTVCYPWTASTIFYKFLWQDYYESDLAAQDTLKLCPSRKNSLKITGTPFADLLLDKPACDPWKQQPSPKKRIIYAPHFSIADPHDPQALYIGTFLQFGEKILEYAQRFSNETQWAFKPHPCLKRELIKQWGVERTDEYFNKWAQLDNAQYAEGQYLDLFKHSDAIIHDCSSFICEYMFMQKPALFLHNGNSTTFNHLAQAALQQHYHATECQHIEEFIANVISGNDTLHDQRKAFFEQSLLPPNGKSAAENIIDAILGQ